MGLIDSPYHACQVVTWDKSVALGYRQSLNNPFGWDKVVVNLPVTTTYYYQLPWFYKERRDGLIVANWFVYVGDGRPIVPTEKLCWEVYSRWGFT